MSNHQPQVGRSVLMINSNRFIVFAGSRIKTPRVHNRPAYWPWNVFHTLRTLGVLNLKRFVMSIQRVAPILYFVMWITCLPAK